MFSVKSPLAFIVLLGLISFSLVSSSEAEGPRVKRAPTKEVIPGGTSHINIDDPSVQESANFAVSSISEGSGSSQKLGLFKVVSATRQVVSGALYTIKLQVAPTNCTKTAPPPSAALCSVHPNSDISNDPDFGEYTVKVWDQPWRTPRFQVTFVEKSETTLKKKQTKKSL